MNDCNYADDGSVELGVFYGWPGAPLAWCPNGPLEGTSAYSVVQHLSGD